uniref:dihydropteroate synthase n=1 Tax=Candidatus Scatousia sp. TaxID=3085663 RepID=UPI0040263836
MHDFLVKEVVTDNIKPEIEYIGFDKSYAPKVIEKFQYKNLKVFGLTPAQANILKQTAISVGADCATHREVITGKIEKSDCILGGSLSQIRKIAEKLQFQPFGLKVLGAELLRFQIKTHKTKIMGILNVTDNSFSDGGEFLEPEKAFEHLKEMVRDGADIIDIGAESTRPYSEPVSADVQLKRLLPVLELVKKAKIKVPLSIDTRSAEVAEKCIKAGAVIVNDVSGMTYDWCMADVVAKYGVHVIIQHSKGTPENMQKSPEYKNLMDEIILDINQKIDFALTKGIEKNKIIIDPGIGFGKTRENNFEIIRRLTELYALDCPVMLGLSRKSLLNMQDEDNLTKDIFTVALNTIAVENGVDIIRVHNVKLHKQLLNILLK